MANILDDILTTISESGVEGVTEEELYKKLPQYSLNEINSELSYLNQIKRFIVHSDRRVSWILNAAGKEFTSQGGYEGVRKKEKKSEWLTKWTYRFVIIGIIVAVVAAIPAWVEWFTLKDKPTNATKLKDNIQVDKTQKANKQ